MFKMRLKSGAEEAADANRGSREVFKGNTRESSEKHFL
jgi:hypothetical protein